MKRYWILSLIIALLWIPQTSWAQMLPDQASQATLEIQPRYPTPGETVVIELSDYVIASQVNRIEWFIDGQLDSTLANERSISLVVGDIGETTTVEARMMLASGQPRVVSATITPSRVLLTIEPETGSPSWYQGRAMPSVGSDIRVIAIPQTGAGLPPSAYSYTWRLNESITNRGAVAGRFSERFTVPFGRGSTLSVDVTDQTGTVVARRSVFVPSVAPQLYFYTTNPLRGQQPLALTQTTPLIGDELTIRAEPFHLGSADNTADMLYEWEVNGRSVSNPSLDPQTITLQRGEGSGRFSVGFHIRNLRSLLQGTEADFTVTF
jgi:hypothetical protein